MSGAFTVQTSDGVAIVTFDLPGEPINKLSSAVQEEFTAVFDHVRADPAARAVAFLSGKADGFIAGADIEEFVALQGKADAERLSREGQDMLGRVAGFPKPVVVGIHGACLGGGFEFALAAHYRIATNHPRTQLGLPEVQLGIIPAAGGCQRLPRLIGLRAALDMILTGRAVGAEKARRLGLVDEVVPPSILRATTVGAARRLALGERVPRRGPNGVGALVLDRNPLGRKVVYAQAEKTVRRRAGSHYPAPHAALEAVREGLERGMRAGLQREAQLFGELAVGDVSRKLVQIFFATTALKKDYGVEVRRAEVRTVRRLGIVGAGFMGSAIGGVAVAQAGVDTRLRDADYERVAKGLEAATQILDERRRRRRISRFEHGRLVLLLSGDVTYTGFRLRDLVIEAVFEDLGVKRAVIAELEGVLRDDAIIASNTSTIPIARLQEGARLPERVLGMHFFSPVERMPLLEVIATDRTAPQATATAVAFGRAMGKTVIVLRDAPGFWVNRILAPYLGEAGWLLEEGVAIDTIDESMRRFGFPVGPMTLLDEIGLDVVEKAAQVMHEAFGARLAPPPASAVSCTPAASAGRAGRGSTGTPRERSATSIPRSTRCSAPTRTGAPSPRRSRCG